MKVDEATKGRRLRKRKEKIPKNLKREANEKEMDGFTKRVLRIPMEKPFDEVYYTHRLWMFFRETKETEEDIRRMFHYVREKMKLRTTLKKKSDPGKFAIPCVVKVRVVRQQVNLMELGIDLGYIAACYCGAEYETEYSESIDTHTASSFDSNESPTTNEHYPTSLDGKHLVDHFTSPDQFYPDFAFQQPNKKGRDDYSIGSWADSGFHESFAVETVIPSSNEDPTEEYDENYWKERAIEIAMQDERYSRHSFNNTDRINALRPPPKPLANPPEPTTNPSDTTPEPMKVDEATEGRMLRKRKEKIPKNLKREANEKEMNGFTKRVLRIPVEKPFNEVFYTNRLWMFFRETKETEEDIRRMFHHVRERMKLRIRLKKKSDLGKFAIPCVVKGIEFSHALCDTGASVNLVELGNDLGYISACHCGAEYETEYSESINTHTAPSIDSNESPTTDEHYPTSLDGKHPVDHFTLLDQFYPDFAFQQPNKKGRDDYSIGSWADGGFHESFAVETDERYSRHSFNNTSPPSTNRVYSASVDTHPHPAKQSYASIDTTPGTSIDIKAAAFEKKKWNIPIPSRFTNTYIRSFAPQITSHDTIAEKMNAPTNKSEGTSRKSIRSKNPNSADKCLPSMDTPVSTSIDSHSKPKLSLFTTKNMSIDYGFLTPDEFGIFRDPDGHARAMDGRILQVSREDITDILQLANGPDNLFMQQCSIPDNIPAVPDEYPRADTTEIGSHQSCQPVDQTLIDKDALTSFDQAPSPSIDRRYECGRRAYDIYGARKFRWEQKDEYEIYTKDEINEMVTSICGAQEKLGDELKTLVDDTYQTLDREATTSPSIDANKATSIDVKPQTSQIPVEPESLAEKKDEWEIAYINTKINNVDWLSTRIDLLQQNLDTIRKKDQQPATSIDICTITSIDSKFAAMEDRLQTYEDMHDRFTSPIMRYLDTLSTQMMKVQRDIGTLNDQHDFQEECSTSIDRFHRASLDVKLIIFQKPTEHLPYIAAEVDQIPSKLYTAIDTMDDRFEKRCDDIYFPFDVRLSGLDSHAEWLQKEVKAIQRQFASQHQISASIDRERSKSIDSKAPASTDKHLVASIDTTSTPDAEQLIQNKMESMHEELNELSAYDYDKIGWHQFSIENTQERL
ncbi:hypothetical protein DY000_02048676 [Brassica cretica]|uniref:Uncharacterized protein n=1 Tax=Brassica cretica TaxID=69181 RepID=A0ABQ7F2U3_BRACR|nr:hypothetical protein DY000_02048676 [Brassica cretica]